LNDPELRGIAARHITISTSGVLPGIEKLGHETIQVNLAISIHAPNQILREKLMPIAKAYKLDALMTAINSYIQKTNRRVSYEYVMLKNLNDSEELARQFGQLIKGQMCHVNLIPYNETYLGFSNAGKSRIDRFRELLESFDIPVTVRVSLGQDISAACGQLAVQEK
jgi:23S rRNA (adenine2503-C2)-methyltransferase